MTSPMGLGFRADLISLRYRVAYGRTDFEIRKSIECVRGTFTRVDRHVRGQRQRAVATQRLHQLQAIQLCLSAWKQRCGTAADTPSNFGWSQKLHRHSPISKSDDRAELVDIEWHNQCNRYDQPGEFL